MGTVVDDKEELLHALRVEEAHPLSLVDLGEGPAGWLSSSTNHERAEEEEVGIAEEKRDGAPDAAPAAPHTVAHPVLRPSLAAVLRAGETFVASPDPFRGRDERTGRARCERVRRVSRLMGQAQ
jgi:hypothetical protein